MSGDKSAGQWVGGIVGGIVGWFVGGPSGVYAGAMIGSGIGGVIDPPKGPDIKGPRLSDLAQQVSSYGVDLPRIYGTYQTFGNVFWVQGNALIEQAEKKKQGGKGGSESSVTTYHYFGTFAVSLCEGPIVAVKRIWIAGDLWYDAGSDDLATMIQSNRSNLQGIYPSEKAELFGVGGLLAASWTLYRGTDTQDPDPLIEADIGVGKTPAYRGTSYLVFNRLPLEKYGNSIMGAQIKVELLTAGDQDEPLAIEEWGFASGLPHFSLSGTADRVTASFGNSTWGNLDNNKLYSEYDLLPGVNGIIERHRTGTLVANPITAVRSLNDTNAMIHIGGWNVGWVFVGSVSYNVNIWGSYEKVGTNVRYRDGVLYVQKQRLVHRCEPYAYVDEDDPDGNEFSIAATSAEIPDSLGFDVIGDQAYVYTGAAIYVLDAENLTTIGDPYWGTFPADDDWPWFFAGDGRLWLYHGIGNGTLYLINETLDGVETTYALPPRETGGVEDHRVFVESGIMVRGFAGWIQYVSLYGVSDSRYPLADIIDDEISLSSLVESSDVDVSEITEDIRGFRVPGVSSIRNNIGPLQIAHFFDLVPSGYSLKAVPRGQDSVATIDVGELDARPFGQAASHALERSRTEDVQLPRKVVCRYSDPGREGDVSEQYSSERQSTNAVNVREIELPLSLSADEAAAVAQNIWHGSWLERNKFALKLPPVYQHLEPSDVITLKTDHATFQMRFSGINYGQNGLLEVNASEHAAAAWVPNAVGSVGTVPTQRIPVPGGSSIVLLDIPLMRAADDEAGFAAAMYGELDGWSGGALFVSLDEQVFDRLQLWTGAATVGRAETVLGVDSCYLVNRDDTLTVRMEAGELDSITESQMLAGTQHWVAYGADGRWEILLFADAILQGDGTYEVSTLLRGQKGTEWTTALHEADDYFVLLDDVDVIGIATSVSEIDVERYYRAVTMGGLVGAVASETFAYSGVNLTPLAGVNATVRANGGDWVVTWFPRTRYPSSWWSTGVDATTDSPAIYEVDIIDLSASPNTVVRTLTVSDPALDSIGRISTTYTGAQVATDFGSPVPASIGVSIYQKSSVVGRGYELSAVGQYDAAVSRSARHVRFYINEPHVSSKEPMITEIWIDDDSGNAVLTKTETATSSSNYSGSYPASNILDGEVDTITASGQGGFDNRWIAGTTAASWVAVDLGGVKSLGAIHVLGTAYVSSSSKDRCPKDWEIQTSENGTDWATVYVNAAEPEWSGAEIRTYNI